MSRSRVNAVSQAVARIERIVAECRRRGVDALPTIRKLCSITGFSHVTIWKAVRALVDRGVLRTTPGHGIHVRTEAETRAFSHLGHVLEAARRNNDRVLPTPSQLAFDAGVPTSVMAQAMAEALSRGDLPFKTGSSAAESQKEGPDDFPTSPAPRSAAWKRLADDIGKAILNGTYGPATVLPSSKEFTARYGMSSRTVARALRELCRTELLQPHGRGYRVRGLPRPSGANAVVLVQLARPHADSAGLVDYRTHDFFRALESECARTGLELRVVSLAQLEAQGALPNRLDEFCEAQWGIRTVHGYLLRTVGMRHGPLTDVLLSLARTGKPAAVLSETARIDLASLPYAGHRVAHFTMAHSARAGEDMGRHLLQLGHRRVAYVSVSHGAPYSCNRLDGLRSMYTRAGLPDAVRAFTVNATRDEYIPEPDREARMRLVERVERAVRRTRADDRLLGHALAGLQRELVALLGRETVHRVMPPLLQDALSRPDITAWVGATDITALQCRAWLMRRGIAVPGRLSIAGFDDTVEASMARLTSYNFNLTAAAQTMLRQVVAPVTRRPHARKPQEVGGFVAPRASTRPPG
ncbi:MAG: GntR family transcriptional regulator [Chitinivibrionales bacterium]|nr:GntR family transcriptional regulator [Chitinivibrionales bacterium]